MNEKYVKFIYELFEKVGDVTKEDREYFLSKIEITHLHKNDHFRVAGDKEGPMGLVYSGVLRVYLPSASGCEKNLFFRTKGDFDGVYTPYFEEQNKKMWFSTQAITECEIISFSQENLDALKENFGPWDSFEHYIFKFRSVQMENRILSFLTLDAQSRYELFLEEYPNLYNLIPQYHIASYIGINQVSLSRIRGTIK